jgi:hypothetical protein
MKQGTNESLLSLAGSSSDAEATVALTSLLGNIDEKVGDARLHFISGERGEGGITQRVY